MKENKLYIVLGGLVAVIVIITLIVVGLNSNEKKDKDSDSDKTENEMITDSKDSDSTETVSVGGAAMYSDKNIVDNVVNAPNLTTLVAAVQAADLVETLQGPGPFTVFGPDNDAFAKLPAGTLEELVKPENKETLTSILTYHVVSGKLLTNNLKDGDRLTTVQGDELLVRKDGSKTYINNALISTGDVLQNNGVAHVIDTVLLPPSDETEVGGAAMFKNRSIVDNVVNAPNLTTLVAAVQAADLVDALSNQNAKFTVFGPDNDAFAKLPAGTLEELVKPENKETLTSILTYHVVDGEYSTAQLFDGQELTTLNGKTLTVEKTASSIKILNNDGSVIATIITPDVYQSNGVAHVIDSVLIPME